ncbi:MAG: RluA family pseudouridine synthase [Anaerolineae bacterium]
MNFKAPATLPLLEILQLANPASSKNTLRSWVEKGRIEVDGKVIKKSTFQVLKDQEIHLRNRVRFAENGIEVIYEDEHLVVINKPAGLLSVATVFDKHFTAHSILKRRYYSQRVFPVQRLDRETSGVMVFAYTEKSNFFLKNLFSRHEIDRKYLAIVEGVLEEKKGTWKSYLTEDQTYTVRNAEREGEGRLSITHYEVIFETSNLSCLCLKLETGRKNQIRVHCQQAGHPIVGDKKYGAAGESSGRMCLHAYQLGFCHPISLKFMSFHSPIPQAFYQRLPQLKTVSLF